MRALLKITVFLFCQYSFGQGSKDSNSILVDPSPSQNQIKGIFVGIDNYRHLPKLKWACKDAYDLYKVISKLRNADTANLKYLPNPTQADIVINLNEIESKITSNDIVIIYFSGHAHATAYSINKSGLLMKDFGNDMGDKWLKKSLTFAYLYALIDDFQRKGATVFFITDACKTGKIIDKRSSNNYATQFLNQKHGTSFKLVSCESGENSYEDPLLKHGVFTYFLLKGINGEAEKYPPSNFICFKEIRSYVEDNVIQYLMNVHNDSIMQNPKGYGDNERLDLFKHKTSKDKIEKLKNDSVFSSSSLLTKMPFEFEVKRDKFYQLLGQGKIIPIKQITDTIEYIKQDDLSFGKEIKGNICDGICYDLAYLPNTDKVIISCASNVKILSSPNLSTEKTLDITGVKCLDVSPNGSNVALGSWKQMIYIFDTQKFEIVEKIPSNGNDIESIAFSSNGLLLASAGRDKDIVLRQTNSWKVHKQLPRLHSNVITTVLFNKSCRYLFSADRNGLLIKWDISSSRPVKKFQINSAIVSILQNPKTGELIITSKKGNLYILDEETLEKKDVFDLGLIEAGKSIIDRTSHYIFTMGKTADKHEVVVTNLMTAETHETSILLKNTGSNIAISKDNSTVAFATMGGDIQENRIEIRDTSKYSDDAKSLFYEICKMYNNYAKFEKIKSELKQNLYLTSKAYINDILAMFINGEEKVASCEEVSLAIDYTSLCKELYKNSDMITESLNKDALLLEVYQVFATNAFNKNTKAIDLIEDFIENNENSAYPYNILNQLYRRKKDMSEAKKSVNKAIKLAPEWTDPKSNLGKTYFEEGNYDKAITEFKTIIDLRPRISKGYQNIGNVKSFLGYLSEAEFHYNEAQKYDSCHIYLHCLSAIVKAKYDKLLEAEKQLNEVIRIDSNYYLPFLYLGLINHYKFNSQTYKNIRKSQEYIEISLQYYNKAISKNKNDAYAYIYMAKLIIDSFIYFEENNKLFLKRILDAESLNEIPHRMRLKVDYLLGEAKERNPYAQQLFLQKTRRIYLKDGVKGAKKQIKKDAVKPFYKPAFLYSLGRFYEEIGQHTKSLDCYHKSINANKQYLPAYLAQLNLLKGIKKEKEYNSLKRSAIKEFTGDHILNNSNLEKYNFILFFE